MTLHRRIHLLAAIAPLAVLLACPAPTPECGDGTREGEALCTPAPVCGNGVKEGTEVCDDGNAISGDGCENDCTPSPGGGCGNTVVEGNEACDDGNAIPGDGCENDCTLTPVVTEECAPVELTAPTGDATCSVTPGDASRVLIGDVLAPGKVIKGGQVLFDASGTIQCVGCDCMDSAASATKVYCPGAAISPGLINSHDHITYQGNPYVPTSDERYEHRHDWRRGQDGHTKINASGGASTVNVQWAELRQLMAGTTSIAGSGGAPGLLRNLDQSGARQEGLNASPADYETFPLGDSGGGERTADCNYSYVTPKSDATAAWLPHVAEGIEASARNEWVCISQKDTFASFLPRAGIIHGIGVKASDVGQIVAQGASLIWSPRSNIFLYGDTAPIPLYKKMGARIALGTDWVPSGSMNLLRELKCADDLNRTNFGNALTDEELWRAVTANAADLMQQGAKLGRLSQGRLADIAIYKGVAGESVHRAIISAEPQSVVLTLRGGKALYGDEALVKALSSDTCDALEVCGTSKAVCIKSEVGQTFAELSQANASLYPLFACGTPANEPTCTPQRSANWTVNGSTPYTGVPSEGDQDGDGVSDDEDNCPSVFNPIRPLDNGKQSDVDEDGVGDVCDVCPLDANTTECAGVDPGDTDGDGVKNDEDNCPADQNPDQTDTDGDGTGDACDWCPVPNAGGSACPVTIYDVKSGALTGKKISLGNVLVTGVGSNGFFVQVHEDDADYKGRDYSGLFVFGTATVAAGDRVNIGEATVSDYFGQVQLSGVSGIQVASSSNPLPAPVVAAPADLATGGSLGGKLEGVLVRVENVEVTNVTPTPGPGDSGTTNEFEITGGLRVNDYLYLVTPFPVVGEVFSSITGVLEWRNSNMKIEPRNAADLVSGAPVLVDFGPAGQYLREGQTNAPTFPQVIGVSLSRAANVNTFVGITSSSGAVVVANGGVTIPAGASTAHVVLDGVSADPSVTLTATLDGVTKTTTMQVLGANQSSTLSALTAASSNVGPGSSIQMFVELDVPTPTELTVDVSVNPASAGTVPAMVTIPMNAKSGSFFFAADAAATGSATVSATLGGTTKTATLTLDAVCLPTQIVISEVYGGGGNSGSTYTHDFIELHNRAGVAVNIGDWSVQYASAAGTTWQVTAIPAGTILQPGAYFLIQQAKGNGGTTPLPTPDVIGAIAMSGSDAKVALVKSTTALSGACPAGVVDLVGYGSANCSEGTGAAPALSGSISASRKDNACKDTTDNAADFATGAANPQNTASPANSCGCN